MPKLRWTRCFMSRPFWVATIEHFVAVEAGHAADDGGIVAEAAVAVNFAEVGEDALDVVERLRTLRMPRQFGFLPGSGWCIHFAAQGFDAILQFGDLAAGCVVGAGRFQFGDLALDLFQFLLRFFGCLRRAWSCEFRLCQLMRTLPRPHNCSTRAMKLRSGITL